MEISRVYDYHLFPTPYNILTVSQNNILVDLDGRVRIAGLGSALVPPQHYTTWSEIDAELPLYGVAPELVHLKPSAKLVTTKERDVYAFGFMAYEVSFFPQTLFQTFTKPYQSTGFFGTGPFCRSRYSTASTSSPRTIRSNMGPDPTMLARQSISSHANQECRCYS